MKNKTATKKGPGRQHDGSASCRKDKVLSRGHAFPKLFRAAHLKTLTVCNP